ncbi:ABC transporter permease [Albibacillus kandeliae]|uniref:ABC transporter permease n=1 Tax=Albibacillus kandeliae TaxID=2174228 RepID=UPI000D6957D9|nr:ABC transporter permease subunit [Albibacillus kandeliae]
MDLTAFIKDFDKAIDSAMSWATDHGGLLFDLVRAALERFFDLVTSGLLLLPYWAAALVAGAIAARSLGWKAGIATAAGLAFCQMMDLWSETVETMCLVLVSVLLAILIGAPLGILAGYRPRLSQTIDPVLDLIQTLPPYIYLLPSIAFLGYGPATAIAATVIVSVPPVIRLVAHGFRSTPVEFVELGEATGTAPRDAFLKIRLPFALPSIMAGVNQSLMMAFGMVVIAGIVGSGGLGETIYGAVRKLDIALSVNAAIAIVILTIIIDRISQSAAAHRRPA